MRGLFLLWCILSLGIPAEAADWRILAGSNINLRTAPQDNATVLKRLSIGTVFEATNEQNGWLQARFADGKKGWVSASFARPFDPAWRGDSYRQLADERLAKDLSFPDLADLTDFLSRVWQEVESAEDQAALALAYLNSLQKTTDLLNQQDWEQREQPPYRAWHQAASENGQIVYSEPGAEWLPSPALGWAMFEDFYPLPEAEEIAWIAANLRSPGECEGFLTCVFLDIQRKMMKYLALYPEGQYAGEALQQFEEFLDASAGLSVDAAERPLVVRLVAVSRASLEQIDLPEKTSVLRKLSALQQRAAALQ